MYKKQQGFTLIEIAIVLVIIGLLLGGVLKGQEMITNAKIKRLENDFNGLLSAVYSYQDRYQSLPGDDAAAAGRWAAVTRSGNGNGLIAGNWNSTRATDESRLFWQHLRASGLITGDSSSTTLATNAYNGQIGIEDASMGLNGLVVCMGGIPGPIAEIIDIRLDDGDGTTGQLRGDTTPNPGTDSDPYTEAGTFYICKKV